jgi:hypothetical protein
MTRGHSLLDEFHRLRDETNPHLRGHQFQSLVSRTFKAAHFKVVPNPRAARPRQTDLLASKGNDTYLVETKWTRPPATVADIDSLFSRLDTMPSSVGGLLASVSGFSRTAIDRVESLRPRPVILLWGDELQRILEGRDLSRLLRWKRDSLLVDGRVLQTTKKPWRPPTQTQKANQLPASAMSVVFKDGHRAEWLSCKGDFGEFVFALDMPDIDWVTTPGVGVTLDIQVPMTEEEDLVRLLVELADLGWATGSGHWSIHQSTVNWHGAGVRAFADAHTGWKDRYRGLGGLHHTEQLYYQDACEGGFYTLAVDVSASGPRQIWNSDLSFQLTGIPLDPEPFRQLSESFEVGLPLYFRPRNQESVTTRRISLDKQLSVTPVAFIVEEDELAPVPSDGDWVRGIVVENPFPGRGTSGRDALPDWWPAPLQKTGLLICDLRHHHPLGHSIGGYSLWSCEWAWTSEALVFRAVADWEEEAPLAVVPRAPSSGG